MSADPPAAATAEPPIGRPLISSGSAVIGVKTSRAATYPFEAPDDLASCSPLSAAALHVGLGA